MRHLFFGLVLFLSTPSFASDGERVYKPISWIMELGGKTGSFNLGADIALNNYVSTGVGIGWSQKENGSTTAIPMYTNFYFTKNQVAPYVFLGTSLVFEPNGIILGPQVPLNSPFLPFAGFGVEIRSENGFIFRIQGMALFGSEVRPWGGLSLGFAW